MRRKKECSKAHAERLQSACGNWDDWRGWCIKCGHPKMGKLVEHGGLCEVCGFGGDGPPLEAFADRVVPGQRRYR